MKILTSQIFRVLGVGWRFTQPAKFHAISFKIFEIATNKARKWGGNFTPRRFKNFFLENFGDWSQFCEILVNLDEFWSITTSKFWKSFGNVCYSILGSILEKFDFGNFEMYRSHDKPPWSNFYFRPKFLMLVKIENLTKFEILNPNRNLNFGFLTLNPKSRF